jgi:protein-S-isoprenylcysteine O-methyltransferase Ste14
MLFARALLAFLALPLVVAGAVPFLIARAFGELRASPPALALGALGLALLLTCTVEFAVRGRGTLAPWDPPRALVVGGPYRFVRNPMYLGVLALLIAWALASGTPWSWCWAALVAAAFHVRVVRWEEPLQARAFGAQWQAYRARVPRWLPRLRP